MNDDALSQDADDPLIEYLTFTLGNETYGVDVLYVQEVLRSPEIAPVPGSPSHVLGIINLRGKVIAVNGMRTMLGLPSVEVTDETRILLMELDGYVQGMPVFNVEENITLGTWDDIVNRPGYQSSVEPRKFRFLRIAAAYSFTEQSARFLRSVRWNGDIAVSKRK